MKYTVFIALLFMFLPAFAFSATVIKPGDPENNKARIAIKLGIITLAVIFVFGVIAALVIAFGTIRD